MENPLLTKTTLAIAAPAIPIAPHNSQAGKNAPNKSNDGAPFAEQPPRQKDTTHTRELPDCVRKRVIISELSHNNWQLSSRRELIND